MWNNFIICKIGVLLEHLTCGGWECGGLWDVPYRSEDVDGGRIFLCFSHIGLRLWLDTDTISTPMEILLSFYKFFFLCF